MALDRAFSSANSFSFASAEGERASRLGRIAEETADHQSPGNFWFKRDQFDTRRLGISRSNSSFGRSGRSTTAPFRTTSVHTA